MDEKPVTSRKAIIPLKTDKYHSVGPHKQRLGKRLREIRLSRNYTQDKLAELAGISQKYLGEVERGEGNVSIDILTKLAEVLCVPLISILDNEHEQSPAVLREDLCRMIPLLEGKELKMVYRMVKLLTNQ